MACVLPPLYASWHETWTTEAHNHVIRGAPGTGNRRDNTKPVGIVGCAATGEGCPDIPHTLIKRNRRTERRWLDVASWKPICIRCLDRSKVCCAGRSPEHKIGCRDRSPVSAHGTARTIIIGDLNHWRH